MTFNNNHWASLRMTGGHLPLQILRFAQNDNIASLRMTDFARNDRGSPLFPTEIADCIVKQRLLKAVIRNILEQILLIPLSMAHLAEDLTVTAYYPLDGVV